MNASIANDAAAQFDLMSPIPVGYEKIQLIPGNPLGGNMSYHHINVSGGNIGVVNTGYIKELDNNMRILVDAPTRDVINNLKSFTQAVLDDSSLDGQQKNEAIEYLSSVSSELASPAEQRKSRMALMGIRAIAGVIGASSNLATLWSTLHPVLEQFFKQN